jgi:hypothetical protein
VDQNRKPIFDNFPYDPVVKVRVRVDENIAKSNDVATVGDLRREDSI